MAENISSAIIEAEDLHKRFPLGNKLIGTPRNFIYAVNGVSLNLTPGQTVGLVGESGSGKSTVGKLICQLEIPDRGVIRFDGKDTRGLGGTEQLGYRRAVQMIFQNPYTSLNPRLRIGRMFQEIYHVHKLCPAAEIDTRIDETLVAVGLSPEVRERYSFEFSGGQRQRLCIARALTVQPRVVICDEPVSALDVSIQAQILQLLKTLQEKFHLAYLFISHDLSVIYHTCDEVLIMYLGQIVERGPVEKIFNRPAHPYTQALLSAIPVAQPGGNRKHIILNGEIPSPTRIPEGCPFYSRCHQKMDICKNNVPRSCQIDTQHQVSCWLHD